MKDFGDKCSENAPKKSPYYNCFYCGYETSNKKDYKKHCETKKHFSMMLRKCSENAPLKIPSENFEQIIDNNIIDNGFIDDKNSNHKITPSSVKIPKNPLTYNCVFCNKQYKHRQSCNRHEKGCKKNIKSNKEYKNVLQILHETTETNRKLCEKIENMELNSNTTINNQNFNINVYLNNDCKNALPLDDFVKNVTLSIEDLDYTKNNGYIKGITNIFVKNLETLQHKNRPIHCVDKKLQKFYIKNEKWDEDNTHFHLDRSIDTVAKKQIHKIKEWEKMNPNWEKTEKGMDDYVLMVQTLMGGKNETEREKNKILIKKELSESVDINNKNI